MIMYELYHTNESAISEFKDLREPGHNHTVQLDRNWPITYETSLLCKKRKISFSVVQTLIRNLENLKKPLIQLKIRIVLEPITMSHSFVQLGYLYDYHSLPTMTCSLGILLFKENG